MVTDQDLADYRRDGVVLIRNLLDANWLELLAEGLAQNRQDPTSRATEYVRDPAAGQFFFDAVTLGQFEAYDRYLLESPMAQAVARLMGSSRAILFYMTVFVRSPGTRTRTPWHQDQPSWSAAGEQACSLWTSLDPVPAGTALEFVRGSHRWPHRFRRPPFFQTRYAGDERPELAPFPDIEENRSEYDIVSWEMSPGDCLVFHGMTAHGGSGDLPSGLGRRAFSVQWLGDDARFRDLAGLEDDPHISRDLMRYGVRPGDSPVCDICPVVWPRGARAG